MDEPFLCIRKELVEYGLIPAHILFPSLESVTTLVHDIHASFLRQAKLTERGERMVSTAALADQFGVSEEKICAFIDILDALRRQAHLLTASSRGDTPQAVNVHELSLFLVLQLFAREALRPETNDHWPEPAAPIVDGSLSPARPTQRSPGLSSTSRTFTKAQLKMQTSACVDFLKRNIRKVLLLCLDEPPPADANGTQPAAAAVLLKAHEVDRLSFLLDSQISDMRSPSAHDASAARNNAQLSRSIPGMSQRGSCELEEVAVWLLARWREDGGLSPQSSSGLTNGPSSVKVNRSMGLVGASGHVDETSITGVSRGTVVRGEADFPSGEALIADCHDTIVYALAPLRFARVAGCSDCTIVVGAVSGMLRVEHCERVQIIAACARLLINTCRDSSFCVGVNHCPALVGDNRFITLAPHNTRYERLSQHLQRAGLRTDLNRWASPIMLGGGLQRRLSLSRQPESPRWFGAPGAEGPAQPGPGEAARGVVAIMPAEEFLPFVVPFKGGAGPLAGGSSHSSSKWSVYKTRSPEAVVALYPFPLPPEYQTALQAKFGFVTDMRTRIKAVVLEESRRTQLMEAIQGYFRDWLTSTNHLRHIYDLSKLEQAADSSPYHHSM